LQFPSKTNLNILPPSPDLENLSEEEEEK